MKGINIIFVLVVFLIVFAGCEDDFEYRIDEAVSTEVSRPLSDMTKQMNDARLGSVLVEGDYSYFLAFEKDGEEIYSRLYKKNRHSGEMICLVERKAVEKVDVTYSCLYLKGDYLYFMLFDGTTPFGTPEDLRGVLCRVRVDGSSPFEIVIKPHEYEPHTSIFGDKAYFACSYNYGFILKRYNLEQGKLEELFFRDDMNATDGRIYYSFDFIYKDYVYYSALDGNKNYLYRCRLDGSDDNLIYDYSSIFGKAIVDDQDRLYINDIGSEKLYVADLDGGNEKLLLSGISISNMNIFDGKFYFYVSGNDNYQSGIYEYQPGYKMPLPLYKGEVLFGPMIDSSGGIWCTLHTQDTEDVVRVGQLHKLDVKSQTWQVVL